MLVDVTQFFSFTGWRWFEGCFWRDRRDRCKSSVWSHLLCQLSRLSSCPIRLDCLSLVSPHCHPVVIGIHHYGCLWIIHSAQEVVLEGLLQALLLILPLAYEITDLLSQPIFESSSSFPCRVRWSSSIRTLDALWRTDEVEVSGAGSVGQLFRLLV